MPRDYRLFKKVYKFRVGRVANFLHQWPVAIMIHFLHFITQYEDACFLFAEGSSSDSLGTFNDTIPGSNTNWG